MFSALIVCFFFDRRATKVSNCCVSAATLTVYVHRWQNHRHLGSTSFVVVGGRKQEMILRAEKKKFMDLSVL